MRHQQNVKSGSKQASNKHIKQRVQRYKPALFSGAPVIGAAVLLSQMVFIPYVYSAPVGGNVVGGAGHIHQDGLHTTVNQNTQRMAIDWQSYNLGVNEHVHYIQPNSKSVSLNRILSNSASTIRGRIDANGQVILVNPNGVFFTATSVINVGGIIAAGLDIKPTDFMNGNYIFNEVMGTEGKVINSGIINASLGGNVALIGKQVQNNGLIVAKLGSVTMAAGKEAVLTFDNSGLVGVKITKAILQNELGVDPAVLNKGVISAEAGRVLLTASVSQDIFSLAVNTDGITQAKSVVVNNDGTFTLGAGADVANNGTIDVSSTGTNQDGGQAVLLGENVISSGNIKADAKNGNGGEIELHATNKTLLTENSTTTARSESNGTGGIVKVLGDKVGLFDQARVDVSGANGGGTALIGGDYQGKNTQVRNASKTIVGPESIIKADAINSGDGGKVIVWADDTTRFYGKIFSRGGINSGNGGFAEVSGKEKLAYRGYADLTAYVTTGLKGTLLLDPKFIRINNNTSTRLLNGNTSFTRYDNFSDGSNTSDYDLNAGDLSTQLNGADVTLQANTDILVEVDVTATSGSRNLALHAGRSIIFSTNANVTLNGGNFEAIVNHSSAEQGNRDSGLAAFTMNTGSSIVTNGGKIDIKSDNNNNNNNNIGVFTLQTLNSSNSAGNNAGTIKVVNDVGNIIANNQILAQGGVGVIDGNGGDGGAIKIEAKNGDVTVNALISSAGGNGGALSLPANNTNGGNADKIDIISGGNNTNRITLGGDLLATGGIAFGTGTIGDGASITVNSPNITTTGTRQVLATGENNNSIGHVNFYFNNSTNTYVNNLILGGSLTVSSGNAGDVIFNSRVDYDGISAGTLSLNAGNDVLAIASIIDSNTNTADQLDVRFSANTDGDANGNVILNGIVNTKVDINTGGGAFDVTGVNYDGRSFSSSEITVDTNSGRSTIKMTGYAILGKMVVGSLDVSAGASIGGNAISQGSRNSVAPDTLTVTGTTNLTSTGVNGDIVLNNNNNLQGNINFKTTGDYRAAIEFNNVASTTTINNVDVYGDMTVKAANNLTVSGVVNGYSDDGSNAVRTTTLDFSFGRDTTATSASTFTSTGATIASSNLAASNDRVNVKISAGTNGANTNYQFNINDVIFNKSIADSTLQNTYDISIVGNSGDNIFNIATNVVGSNSGLIDGSAGNDTFNINAAGLTISDINGGGNNGDVLVGASEINTWTLTNADNQGNLNNKINFRNLENLTGNQNVDNFILNEFRLTGNIDGVDGLGTFNSITANTTNNTWNITSNDGGTVTGIGGTFSNIETLIGNTGNDDFTIADTFSITDKIDGGLGSGTNTLTINTSQDNTWNINDINGGTVTVGISNNFSNIHQVTGGSGVDAFTVAASGSIRDMIDGGAGTADTLDLSALTTVDVVLGTSITTKTTDLNVNGVETITGNNDGTNAANLNKSSLTAESTVNSANAINNTWNITGGNSGDVTSSTGTVNFINFTDLNGGDSLSGVGGDDTFIMAQAGSISGIIDGKSHNTGDSVDLSAFGTVNLNIGNLGNTNYRNIERYIGNNSGTNISTVIGESVNSRWNITGTDTGSVTNLTTNNTIYFTNFNYLTGDGVASDTFIFDNGASISGIVNGGAGTGVDVVDMSAATSAMDVALGTTPVATANSASTTVNNIETIYGDDIGNNVTLYGDNRINTWSISGANKGDVNSVNFVNVGNLTGNQQNDTFNYSTGAASVINMSGLIDGGVAGNNVLNMNNLTGNISVILGTDVTRVSTINGNNATTALGPVSTIVGDLVLTNTVLNWNIDTGVNSGTASYTDSNNTAINVRFNGFNKIQGRDNVDDVFNITSGKIQGTIDGGGGTGIDSVDYSLSTNVSEVVVGDASNGILGIEQVIGDNSKIILKGVQFPNVTNSWTIANDAGNSLKDGYNDGVVRYDLNDGRGVQTLSFVNFSKLAAGTSGDDFTINSSGTFEGTITGGTGIDRLTVNLNGVQTGTLDFVGGSGNNDIVMLQGGSATHEGVYTSNVNGGQFAYTDTSTGNMYTVKYSGVAATNGVTDNATANILRINGATAGSNTIKLTGSSLFKVNSAPEVIYANKSNLEVYGGAGSNDVIELSGDYTNATGGLTLSAETLNDNGNTITVQDLVFDGMGAVGSSSNNTITRVNIDVDSLGILNSGAVYLREAGIGDVNLTAMNTSGIVDLNVDNSVTSSAALISSGNLNITSRTGSISLTGQNQLAGPLSFTTTASTGDVNFVNTVGTNISSITTNNLTIDNSTGTGDITQTGIINATGNVNLRARNNITLGAANNFDAATNVTNLTAGGNIYLNTSGSTNRLNLTGTNSAGGTFRTLSNGLSAGSISAGSIDLAAGGATINVNSLTAGSIKMRATGGISSNGGSIQTNTAALDVINSTSGVVDIVNSKSVLLTNLVNQGAINFVNTAGDVTIRNIDSGYDNANGHLVLHVNKGSVYGSRKTNPTYQEFPDITANSAEIVVFDLFGTGARPISLKIQNKTTLISKISSVYFYNNREPVPFIDNSDVKLRIFDALSGLSGQQILEIDSLEDVDPAVFTEVKNYDQDSIALKMPKDQVYED